MSISVFFCEIKRRMDSLLIAWNRVLHRSEYDSRYLSIALPAAWEGLLMILLSNADLIMVGKLGTAAVAAVSIFTQPRMILLTLSRSLAAVLTLLAARHYGRQEPASAGSLMKQTLFFWGILLAIAHLLFYHCLADILIWMGAENSYLPEALRYAGIALLAVFLSSMTVILQAVPLGFGETAAVLWTNLRGNILNIIVSAILIFDFRSRALPCPGGTGSSHRNRSGSSLLPGRNSAVSAAKASVQGGISSNPRLFQAVSARIWRSVQRAGL